MKNGMKRILAFLLCATMPWGALSLSGQELSFEEGSYQEEAWVLDTQEEATESLETDLFTSGEGQVEEAAEDLFVVPETEAAIDVEGFTTTQEVPAVLVEGVDSFESPAAEEAEELAPFAELTEGWEPLPEPEYEPSVWESEDVLVSLPQSFDSRQGYVSSVKNQRPFGMCWAFATMATLETWLLRKGEKEYDFSEEHLAYFISHREDDPLHNTTFDKNEYITGGEYAYRSGGNQYLASLFLSTWSGFADESLVPYPTDETHTESLPTSAKPEMAYQDTAYLTDAVFTKVSEDRVKTLVFDYGALGISIYLNTSYYNTTTHAYSCPTAGKVNHAVTIVGWDDTYPKENFKETSGVTRDGAYIAKNSWGESWGEGGYFYISYDCPSLANGALVTGTLNPEYPNNYFYDGTSSWGYYVTLSNNSSSEKIANIYEVKAGHGSCEELGEVVLMDYTDNSTYEIQVYTNLTDLSDPTSGTKVFAVPQIYHKDYAGIATVKLQKDVLLMPDTYFSVVISNGGTKNISYLKDSPGLISAGSIRYDAHEDPNQSLVYDATRKVWTDLVSEGSCARIKAHTRTVAVKPDLSLSAESLDLYAGYEKQIEALLSPPDLPLTYQYSSSNPMVATVDGTGVVKGVSAGETVVSVSVAGASLSASLPVKVESIAAPANLRFTSKSYAKLRVDWDKVPEVSGYLLYRKKGKGELQLLADVKSSKLYYADKTVVMGETYTYCVKAYQLVGGEKIEGDASQVVSSMPADLLPCASLTTTVKKGYVKLKWPKVSGADGFFIERKVGDGRWKKLKTLTTATTRTYKDTTVKAKKTYAYRIKAYRKVNGKKFYSTDYATTATVTAK